MRQTHQITEDKEEDFSIRSQQEMSDFFNANNRVMTILISAFAGISLVEVTSFRLTRPSCWRKLEVVRPTGIVMKMSRSFPARVGLVTLLAVTFAVACNKAPPPTAESLARHGPPSIPSGAAPELIVVPDSGNPEVNLRQLSIALRKYIAGSHRMPKDFDDFLAQSGVRPPPPPTGKRYVIQGQVIVLANQ